MLRKVRGWNELRIGREIVFVSENRRYHYRVEAKSESEDMLMVSLKRSGKKRKATTFLFSVQHWIDEGMLLVSDGRRAH